MENQIKRWQIHLAIWGGMFWFISFPIIDFANKKQLLHFSKPIAGYVIGVITGFAGFAIYEILTGNFNKLVAQEPIFKQISTMSFLIIIGFGAFGIISTNLMSISSAYNVAVLLGSVVSGWGIIPLLKCLDS
ncbi:MAG: hypothetical protein CXR30_16930 [Geobacter sp.]|nr:MAG: hypothetical protein CXR30_16930 [Geobacter sp.]